MRYNSMIFSMPVVRVLKKLVGFINESGGGVAMFSLRSTHDITRARGERCTYGSTGNVSERYTHGITGARERSVRSVHMVSPRERVMRGVHMVSLEPGIWCVRGVHMVSLEPGRGL